MVKSDSYGSENFSIILKIGISLPGALPPLEFESG